MLMLFSLKVTEMSIFTNSDSLLVFLPCQYVCLCVSSNIETPVAVRTTTEAVFTALTGVCVSDSLSVDRSLLYSSIIWGKMNTEL